MSDKNENEKTIGDLIKEQMRQDDEDSLITEVRELPRKGRPTRLLTWIEEEIENFPSSKKPTVLIVDLHSAITKTEEYRELVREDTADLVVKSTFFSEDKESALRELATRVRGVDLLVIDDIDHFGHELFGTVCELWPNAKKAYSLYKAKRDHPVHPLDIKTKKFTPEILLYEQEGFVVASGIWEGDIEAYAVRWHVPGELGYPNGFGRPQWMVLPELGVAFSEDWTGLSLEFEGGRDHPQEFSVPLTVDEAFSLTENTHGEWIEGTPFRECNQCGSVHPEAFHYFLHDSHATIQFAYNADNMPMPTIVVINDVYGDRHEFNLYHLNGLESEAFEALREKMLDRLLVDIEQKDDGLFEAKILFEV